MSESAQTARSKKFNQTLRAFGTPPIAWFRMSFGLLRTITDGFDRTYDRVTQ